MELGKDVSKHSRKRPTVYKSGAAGTEGMLQKFLSLPTLQC